MVSKLGLDIQDTSNPRTLRIKDLSEYNSKLDTENSMIHIKSPGFTRHQGFKVKPYFDMAFNASLLGISTTKSKKDLIDLPDGLYNINYSIKPNDKIYVEYDYFRTVRLLYKYMKAIEELFDKRFKVTKKDFEEKRRQLFWIRELIDVSKYKVEECDEFEKGMELYNEATMLLNHYSLNCAC